LRVAGIEGKQRLHSRVHVSENVRVTERVVGLPRVGHHEAGPCGSAATTDRRSRVRHPACTGGGACRHLGVTCACHTLCVCKITHPFGIEGANWEVRQRKLVARVSVASVSPALSAETERYIFSTAPLLLREVGIRTCVGNRPSSRLWSVRGSC
jgi:hypothetical protein